MASTPWSMFSPFSQAIERFIYEPTTNWSRFISPQVNFNYNPQDEGIEAHVLGKVGSYGSQISTLIDMVELMRRRIDDGSWPTDAKAEKAIGEFDALRTKAERAVDEYRGRMTADDIVNAAEALAKREPDSVDALRARLAKLLADKAPPGA